MGKKSRRRAAGQGQAQQRQQGSSSATLATTHRERIEARYRHRRYQQSDRAVADHCMQEFVRLSSLNDDPWMSDRVKALVDYSCLLPTILATKEFEQQQEEDWKFLKKIRRSDTEPVFFRFIALESTGWISLLSKMDGVNPRKHLTMSYFDRASELCDSTSNQEKLRTLNLSDGSMTVGDFMTQRRAKWLRVSNKMAEEMTYGTWHPSGTDMAEPIIPGSQCDCCEKSRQTLGVLSFLTCSRCQMAYYCSVECQRKAWKEQGHKRLCRKKGEFKPGDAAYILKASGNISSGEKVRIVAAASGLEQENSSRPHWVVHLVDDEEKVAIVSNRYLQRIRPGSWNLWTQADIDHVAKEVLKARNASENDGDCESDCSNDPDVPDLGFQDESDDEC